jgi:ATP-dependent Clp protease ATP-binding subunit ClpB
MRSKLESRRGAVAAVRALQSELEQARAALAEARDKKNFAKLGELEHVTVPGLEKRLATAEEAARNAGVHEVSRVVEEPDVAATLEVWTGIPVAKMLEGEADKLLKMEDRLGERVVGQDDAVRAISRAVRRGRVGLRDPGKPIGSFLFLGPSGVGKTELGKALAEFLFDDESALTRLDMSEFMERHMAQRLIGAPPGYADSEQGGFLTEAVRRRAYSVLLFDEVEKAHQDVFNLLLQVLDDGRLTDGRGRTADFSNTVVIMTSNIGSQRILESDPKLFESDDGREALRDVLVGQLGEFFRPEFLNRIDDVVVFRSLAREHLRKIVDIQLKRLERLLADRKIRLDLDDAAKDRLVELGYEPALGARPLRRAILKQVQDPLAEALLSGKFPDGCTVHVRLKGEEFTFEAK